MIQNHVVSLDLAKQLYEAGIKIESEAWWEERAVGRDTLGGSIREWHLLMQIGLKSGCEKWETSAVAFPAPVATEIADLLPHYLEWKVRRTSQFYKKGETVGGGLDIEKEEWGYRVSYGGGIIKTSKTMQDAMAKMLLYLKEKGLL